jgi:hypothetical protein
MFYTARQLESLLKETGKVVLPYRARLTPLAQDWVRKTGVSIGYSDAESPLSQGSKSPDLEPPKKAEPKYLWWCDGPCGSAKAAIMNASREASLEPMAILEDSSRVLSAIRHLSREVKTGAAAGGVLIVKHSGVAGVYANRCSSLRAIVGTTLPAMEAAINELAANVLILEADQLTLREMKHLILRFAKAPRELRASVVRELSELR